MQSCNITLEMNKMDIKKEYPFLLTVFNNNTNMAQSLINYADK